MVGSGPTLVEAGTDRELAVEKAVEILNESDTVVFLGKVQSKIGQALVTKDQLVLTRKQDV